MKRALRWFGLIALSGGLVSAAHAEVVTADDILRIEFTVDNNFVPQPPDVLLLNFGLIQVLQPFTTRIAELYDGNTLLGTAMTSSFGNHVGALNLDPSNSWRTASSVWRFDNPGIADFGPILDGTIDGRIDFMIATGAVDIPLGQVRLSFIRATGPSSGIVVTPVPTITSVAVVPRCPGDLDGDGDVDLADLGILLADFGCTGGSCSGDVDGDGDTDLGDLGILLANFGVACA